jgi:alpha-mannosidase
MSRISRRGFLAAAAAAPLIGAERPTTVYVVPNFHPASCGWLTNFSKERVYCANSYFDHLDRVRDDPKYNFVLSEVNNMIAMLNFHPERKAELQQRIREGRVELVNGFFLESTINLSGGEALVRLGIEGMRWQERMFGVKPRFAWTIDVCGTHEQMPQICTGLGLEAMVYTRKNPTGKTLHWAEAPDGSRVLAISPGHYSDLRQVMKATGPLSEKELAELDEYFASKKRITPEGAPMLALAGSNDYALAPLWKENPTAFLKQWNESRPGVQVRFTTLGKYVDAIQPDRLDLPVMRGGTAYDFNAFWIQNPRVKRWYRDCEHALAAAESLATAASLEAKYAYPVDTLYQAWLQMFLNMDRNTLWGAAGGMVFEHERSWDARDRFEWVERASRETVTAAATAWLAPGDGVALLNPLSWDRRDPFFVAPGTPLPEAAKAHVEPDRILCAATLSAGGIASHKAGGAAPPVKEGRLEETIRTAHFTVKVDRVTGALTSLRVMPAGTEMLGGPANTLVAEKSKKQHGDVGDFVSPRAERDRLGTAAEAPVEIKVWTGQATVVEVTGTLLGKPCRRRMWFHNDFPRIDFETELNGIPDAAVVVTEFPLAADITEVRRGIPYGFTHGWWTKESPALPGWTQGVVPAVRWSHYQMAERGGFAILDRGLSGRELTGNTPVLFLYNASDKYYGFPNSWLSGAGKHVLQYAIVAHTKPWVEAQVVQRAWEFNSPPVVVPGCKAGAAHRWVETSQNMVVESLRREGAEIELRMVESLGVEGVAAVALLLPFSKAWVTDMQGGHRKLLEEKVRYRLPVRPQQILTLRFRVGGKALPEPKMLTEWDSLAPASKRAALHEHSNEKGLPPRGK